MVFRTFSSRKRPATAAVLVVVLVLFAALLCGCASQQASSGEASESQSAQITTTGTTSWKTVGDALATQTEPLSSSWDEQHYVNVFQDDGSYFRIVADVDEAAYKAADAVDCCTADYNKQIEEAFSGLALTSAENITGDKIAQEELDEFVGKTGKDVADAGFKFMDYNMYGEGDAGAHYDKGYFSYAFVFDPSVAAEDIKDGGASLQNAVVKSVELYGAADDVVDVSKL